MGHRIVHGGPGFERLVLITQGVKRVIAKVAKFAPLHNQAELEGIDLVEELLGIVPQVAVFDTSFHRNLPRSALKGQTGRHNH